MVTLICSPMLVCGFEKMDKSRMLTDLVGVGNQGITNFLEVLMYKKATNRINTGQYGWLAGHSSLTNGLRGYVSSSYTNSTGGKFYAASWKVNGGTTASNTNGNNLNSTNESDCRV